MVRGEQEAQGTDRHPSMRPQPYSGVPAVAACPWPSPRPRVAVGLSPCGCRPLPAVAADARGHRGIPAATAHRWMSPVPAALLVHGHRPPHGHCEHVGVPNAMCTPCPLGPRAQGDITLEYLELEGTKRIKGSRHQGIEGPCPRVTGAWMSPHPTVTMDAWMSPCPRGRYAQKNVVPSRGPCTDAGVTLSPGSPRTHGHRPTPGSLRSQGHRFVPVVTTYARRPPRPYGHYSPVHVTVSPMVPRHGPRPVPVLTTPTLMPPGGPCTPPRHRDPPGHLHPSCLAQGNQVAAEVTVGPPTPILVLTATEGHRGPPPSAAPRPPGPEPGAGREPRFPAALKASFVFYSRALAGIRF